MSRLERVKAWCAHAFAVAGEAGEPSLDARELLERLAGVGVRRGRTTPALMGLETGRPLTFVGSQVLAFAGPFARLVFSADEYDRFVRLLERRESIDLLIDAIVEQENRKNG